MFNQIIKEMEGFGTIGCALKDSKGIIHEIINIVLTGIAGRVCYIKYVVPMPVGERVHRIGSGRQYKIIYPSGEEFVPVLYDERGFFVDTAGYIRTTRLAYPEFESWEGREYKEFLQLNPPKS